MGNQDWDNFPLPQEMIQAERKQRQERVADEQGENPLRLIDLQIKKRKSSDDDCKRPPPGWVNPLAPPVKIPAATPLLPAVESLRSATATGSSSPTDSSRFERKIPSGTSPGKGTSMNSAVASTNSDFLSRLTYPDNQSPNRNSKRQRKDSQGNSEDPMYRRYRNDPRRDRVERRHDDRERRFRDLEGSRMHSRYEREHDERNRKYDELERKYYQEAGIPHPSSGRDERKYDERRYDERERKYHQEGGTMNPRSGKDDRRYDEHQRKHHEEGGRMDPRHGTYDEWARRFSEEGVRPRQGRPERKSDEGERKFNEEAGKINQRQEKQERKVSERQRKFRQETGKMEDWNKSSSALEMRKSRFEADMPKSSSKDEPRAISPDKKLGPVVGTSDQIEKQFFRLTSAPKPETVRPLEVLKKTLEHLKEKWTADHNYNFICNQLKSLRQDLTVQRIQNGFTVKVYEAHARIALETGDVGEYNQCQTQLRALYKQNLGGHPQEFLAYRILYFIYTRNTVDMNRTLAEITLEDRTYAAVTHAMETRRALAIGNYRKFFKLYLDTPNLGGYLMDLFVARERVAAMTVFCKAYVTILCFGQSLS